jgi:NADPH-dependent ferric siderophore reductase
MSEATSVERRPFPLATGIASVTRLRRITPAMVRMTLASEALVGFPCEEPGEIVTLLWPEPGKELVLPEAGWRFPPGVVDRQHARNYTVRAWNAEEGEIDVDFFLHGALGAAAAWAEEAAVGDTVGFAGPRTHWVSSGGYDWTVLVGDETGLPALAAIIETLPAAHPVIALVEVDNMDERQTIETDAELDLRWIYRDGAAPGTVPYLQNAFASLAFPEGRGRVWGAAEAAACRTVRDHAKKDRGLPSESVMVLGYWKHRTTEEWD